MESIRLNLFITQSLYTNLLVVQSKSGGIELPSQLIEAFQSIKRLQYGDVMSSGTRHHNNVIRHLPQILEHKMKK